ncbi:MAG: DUF1573 domain-containing protein [Phycisphaerae bacterium]|nr:DUF1573 domain-containing protein [Phycisphaerae bacterium]
MTRSIARRSRSLVAAGALATVTLTSLVLAQTTPPATAPATRPAAPTAPARPAQNSTPPATAPADGPSHADDANAELPEGLKVRAAGPKPAYKGGPAIYFEELDKDFGNMTNAETRSHRFYFVNAGDAPLTLERVIPKCGCTKPKYTPATFQPGERGFIDVDFTPPTGGHQAKALVVVTNAMWPAPEWNIRVIGKVESVLSFEPKSFDLGEIARGAKVAREAVVTADAKSTIFDSVTSRSPGITASFLGEAPHTGEVRIKIESDGTLPWGALRGGVIMLNTRGRTEGGADITKSLPFRLTGVVSDNIRASEYLVQFGTVRPGQPFTKTTYVFAADGKDFELTNATYEPLPAGSKGIAPAQYNPVTVEKTMHDGKPAYAITLSGKADDPSRGFMSGSIKFTTKMGDAAPETRELAVGGRIMTEEQEKTLPTNLPRR